jgi:hypothetical protein
LKLTGGLVKLASLAFRLIRLQLSVKRLLYGAIRGKRIHTTPAMAAGVSDHVSKIEEIVMLLD